MSHLFHTVNLRSYQTCEQCGKHLEKGTQVQTSGRYYVHTECLDKFKKVLARRSEIHNLAAAVELAADDVSCYDPEKVYGGNSFVTSGRMGAWVIYHKDTNVMLELANHLKAAIVEYTIANPDKFGPEFRDSGEMPQPQCTEPAVES